MTDRFEKALLETSRFAIFSAQVAGYLPLSIKNYGSSGHVLQHSWKSIPTLSSFVSLSIIIGWTVIYYVIFKPKIRFVRIFGPTEQFSYALIVIIGTTMGVFLRVRAFRKGVPEFFQENCKLLEKFETAGLNISGLKEISKIQRYMRWSFVAYIVPLVIHCILVHGIRPVLMYYQYGKWLPDIVYTIGSGFWVFWSYLLISNLWIILFPRIYSALYKEISKDIKNKFHKTNNANNLYSWYGNEICKSYDNNASKVQQNSVIRNGKEIELKVKGYLELILQLGKMIDRFNQEFGERLMCEMITCISFIVLYAFFACFWANRGQIRIIGEILTPLYVNGKKLVELGYSCGNISKEGQAAMKALIDNVPLNGLSLGTKRKIRLMQIQLESNPLTISAKQFFTISRGSVTAVLTGATGFLVALVQFRQGDDI